MTDRDVDKKAAANAAVQRVCSGMRVGLGSGTTAAWAIRRLGERIRDERLVITAVATSHASRDLAVACGVPLVARHDGFELDIAIDGADEATSTGDLVKGGGGALLHERIVAAAARRLLVVIDSSKLVERLGVFPLPVEVVAFGWQNAARRIAALGCIPALRQRPEGSPFRTDEDNLVLDCRFTPETMPPLGPLAAALRAIPGVVDHGLFVGMTHTIFIGRSDEVEEIVPGEERPKPC